MPSKHVVRLKIESESVDGLSASDFGLEVVAGAALWEPLGGYLELDAAAPMRMMCATWAMGDAAATTNAAGTAVDCLYAYGLSREARVHLFAHEVGHALGLLHVGEADAIMYPDMTRATDLAPADVEEFERVYP